MSSSNFPQSFIFEATPNSSKLAEILLQLKDDGISRLVQTNDIGFAPSQQTVYDDEVDNEAPTLPANEACNCRKSRCLKLYCQCFAGQAVCGQFCRCVECENRTTSSLTRMIAIRTVLERNPNAFESKYKTANVIAEADEPSSAVAHKNGCRCRKSMCLKKYCECFQGGVHCSGICTCVGCYNREGIANPLMSTRSLPETNHERNNFGESHHITTLQESQTLSILQGLKRAYSEGDSVQTDSPPTTSKPSNIFNSATKADGLTRQHSLNSDPGVTSATKPPLVPLIKRRKVEHNGSGGINSSSSGLPPSTPSAMSALASVLQNSSTPITIRSTSPNTLSIAKALSLLGNSKVQITIENSVGTPIAEFTARGGNIEQQAYTSLPEQFLTSSQPESSSDHSGENSADTSVELTDGDVTNSENECNTSNMDKLEEDCDGANLLLSGTNSVVIHVE